MFRRKPWNHLPPITLIRNLDYNAMLKAEQFGSFWYKNDPNTRSRNNFSNLLVAYLLSSLQFMIWYCLPPSFSVSSTCCLWSDVEKLIAFSKIIWWFIDASVTLSSPFTCLIFGRMSTAVSMHAHPKLKLSIKTLMRWWTDLLESNWNLEDTELFVFEGMLMNLVL